MTTGKPAEIQNVQVFASRSSQFSNTNIPTLGFFIRPDTLPVTQPTISMQWRQDG